MERKLWFGITMKYENELIADIKSKRELKALDDTFVKKKIHEFLKKKYDYQYKEKVVAKLENAKSYKQFSKSVERAYLLKNIRAELRKVYGVFILDDYEKRYEVLKSYDPEDEFKSSEMHLKILNMHKSTKERLENYPEIYENIFSFVESYSGETQNNNPNSDEKKYIILDLGCGLNPVSSVFFQDKIIKYIASDISENDCDFIRKYFKTVKLDSEVFQADLADEKSFEKLHKIKADICFIFKTLDGLERVNRGVSEKLLKSLNVDFVVVSFSTLSIGGRNTISTTRRFWFEELLNRTGWEYEKFEYPAELFYIMKKN